jgi:hypothetical protein
MLPLFLVINLAYVGIGSFRARGLEEEDYVASSAGYRDPSKGPSAIVVELRIASSKAQERNRS